MHGSMGEGRRSRRRLGAALMVCALATTLGPARAEPVVVRGADLPGLKAHPGDPRVPCLVLPDDGLRVPVVLPAGAVRLRVFCRYNGKGEAFRAARLWLWVGPFVAGETVTRLGAEAPVTLTFMARQAGPAQVYFSLRDLPGEARNERLRLRREDRARARGGDPGGLDPLLADDPPGGTEGEQFAAELADPDSSHWRAPAVLLERLEVEALPPAEPRPEIANVVPAIRVASPSMILGEQLTGDALAVHTWQPPTGAAEVQAGLAALATGTPPLLPAEPPPDAVAASILDRDRQLLLAELPGDALWVRNAHGWSRPYLCHRAQPFWLAAATVAPGGSTCAVGFALRLPGGPAFVALRAGAQVVAAEVLPEPPGDDHGDRYRVTFRVSAATPAGAWEVWCNNGAAGRYGWVRGGTLHVAPPPPAARTFAATEFGADGMDEANDAAALRQACAAAAAAGGGEAPSPVEQLKEQLTGLGPQLAELGKASALGTFNAAALLGLEGSGTAERTAQATEETAKNTRKLLDEVRESDLTFD